MARFASASNSTASIIAVANLKGGTGLKERTLGRPHLDANQTDDATVSDDRL